MSTFVPSSRTTTGTLTSTCLMAAITPSAIESQRTMPPKILTRIARTFLFVRMILNASVDALGRRAAADVEKVCGLAAVQLDQVHRRHREARRR